MLPLYRSSRNSWELSKYALKRVPPPPLQKGQLGKQRKKEESDDWMQPPPRAATAHSKGEAALASLSPRAPHCPQPPSQVPWEQGGKQLLSQVLVLLMLPPRGSLLPHPPSPSHPNPPGASPAPSPSHRWWGLTICGHSHQLLTGHWKSVTFLFNLTSLGGFFLGKLSNTCCYSKSKDTNIY